MMRRQLIALGGSTLLPLTGLVLAVMGSALAAAVTRRPAATAVRRG